MGQRISGKERDRRKEEWIPYITSTCSSRYRNRFSVRYRFATNSFFPLSLSLLAPSLFTRTEIPRSKISSICREGIPTITIVSPSFKLKTSREDVVSLFFFFFFLFNGLEETGITIGWIADAQKIFVFFRETNKRVENHWSATITRRRRYESYNMTRKRVGRYRPRKKRRKKRCITAVLVIKLARIIAIPSLTPKRTIGQRTVDRPPRWEASGVNAHQITTARK